MLASKEKVKNLTIALGEQLCQSDRDAPAEDVPCLDLSAENCIDVDWTEGVEQYQVLTKDSALTILGLSGNTFPQFNNKQDINGAHDPWLEHDREWFSLSQNGEDLVPRWHQVIGVLKMIENFFVDRPTLLMDDVGLGKTLQVAGLFSTLAFYRDHHEKNGCFPGKFSTSFHALNFLKLSLIYHDACK